MARNQEKANSMLFRFRESKAASLGLVHRTGPRPKMTSKCTDLRMAERFRGDVLKEISRKVSKIQDETLSDYEARDLNDTINDLMREKANWENRIIELGGANYKRAAIQIVGGEGSEVPGLRGYKYFGRAKELPGVKEIFDQAKKQQAEQEKFQNQRYMTFTNVTPDYYGDNDDQDVELLAAERAAEERDWREQCLATFARLGLPEDTPIPAPPTAEYVNIDFGSVQPTSTDDADTDAAVGDKRKAADEGDAASAAKKTKGADGSANQARILTVLKAEDLRPPQLPSGAEIEAMILRRQKEELLKEYSA